MSIVSVKIVYELAEFAPDVSIAWDANVISAYKLQSDTANSSQYTASNLTKQGAGTAGFQTLNGKACPTQFASNNYYYTYPINAISGLNNLSSYTIEFEVYDYGGDYGRPFFELFDNLGFFYIASANATQLQYNYSNTQITTVNGWSPSVWHHVAITCGAGFRKLYIDYSLVSNIAGGWTWGTMNDSRIGQDWYTTVIKPVTMRNLVISNIVRTTFPTTQV